MKSKIASRRLGRPGDGVKWVERIAGYNMAQNPTSFGAQEDLSPGDKEVVVKLLATKGRGPKTACMEGENACRPVGPNMSWFRFVEGQKPWTKPCCVQAVRPHQLPLREVQRRRRVGHSAFGASFGCKRLPSKMPSSASLFRKIFFGIQP